MKNKYLKTFLEILESLESNPKSLDWYKQQIFNGKFKHAYVKASGFKDFHNSQVFRARSLGKKEDPTNIKSFKYPPLEYNALGRANLISKQVFYGANDPATAMLEFINTGNSSQKLHLARWEFNKAKNIPTYLVSEFQEDLLYLKIKWSKDSDKNTLQLVKAIHDKLVNLYRTENYNFTAPWSHWLLYKHNICDMIKYPSVVTDSQSKNYAINIDFFDDNFHLDKVYVIDVMGKINMSDIEGQNDLMIVMSDLPKEVGEVLDGKVVYRKFNKTDKEFWDYYARHVKG
jgi:hypothetical protein